MADRLLLNHQSLIRRVGVEERPSDAAAPGGTGGVRRALSQPFLFLRFLLNSSTSRLCSSRVFANFVVSLSTETK